MNTCPKCGRKYNCPPALSRADNKTEICPVCGAMEAVAFLNQEDREELRLKIEEMERKAGRIE